MENPTKVLSLFNGMNCIGLALNELNVPFKVYASEINKYTTKVSDALFPDTVNLGDIRFLRKALCWKMETLNKAFQSEYISNKSKEKLTALLYLRNEVFDLVVGGSPCQGFSFAGKQLNFKDPRSKLFFDFVAILKYCQGKNPKLVWLLENVRMKKEYESVISELLGVEPVMINSALMSAQNRVRLYWTNIGPMFQKTFFGPIANMIPQPKDKNVFLKDILELQVGENYYLKTDKKGILKANQGKASCFTAGGNSGGNHSDMDLIVTLCGAMRGRYKVDGKRQDSKGSIAGKSQQELELREDQKTNCLTTAQKDNLVIQLNPSKESNGTQPDQHNRVYDPKGKSPTISCDSRKYIIEEDPVLIQKGHGFNEGGVFKDKSPTMTSSSWHNNNHIFENLRIRRLTPRECCRLQTIPEWAIEIMLGSGVSDSQIYKMLGNGWTIKPIVYILSFHFNNDNE